MPSRIVIEAISSDRPRKKASVGVPGIIRDGRSSVVVFRQFTRSVMPNGSLHEPNTTLFFRRLEPYSAPSTILTDADLDQIAEDVASTDADVESLRSRRRGRPLVGSAPGEVVAIRMDPALRKSLNELASSRG